MDKKSLAIGILIGVLIVGCMVALDDVAETGGRYQFPPQYDMTNGKLPILDTETGTVNWHQYSTQAPTTVVYPFLTESAP